MRRYRQMVTDSRGQARGSVITRRRLGDSDRPALVPIRAQPVASVALVTRPARRRPDFVTNTRAYYGCTKNNC